MKVAVLLGSIRRGRQSHKLAYFLKKMLELRNIEVDLIDLADDPLPLLEDKTGQTPSIAQAIDRISKRLNAADALIFVTPEYHGSFSGVLKNALDYFWAEFQKKPIGVATASAGRMGGINASTQLQHIILSLGAYPLPLKLLVPEVYGAFDDSYNAVRDSLTSSTTSFLDEFIWFAEAITEKRNEVA